MNRPLTPPTRLVTFLCLLIGAMVMGPLLWRPFGKPGLVVGALFGLVLGRSLGRWVQRTFLEF